MFISLRWEMVFLSAVLAAARFMMPSTMSCWDLVSSVALLAYPDVLVLFRDICRSSAASVKISWNFTQVCSVSGSFLQT